MCSIFIYKPGVMPKQISLANAVWNNPHGFGLILKGEDRIQVIRELPDENDPEAIFALLAKHKDVERILHVRWQTVGKRSMDNVHPFPVYSSKKEDIFFAHNGTLYDYKPAGTTYHNEGEAEVSDSRTFADTVLTQILPRFRGEKGNADINDPVFIQIMNKFWPATGNRGVIVSSRSDQKNVLLGDWKTIKETNDDGVEVEYAAANLDYHEKVKRGPELTRREAIAKKAEEEARRQREAMFPAPVVAQQVHANDLKRLPTGYFDAHFKVTNPDSLMEDYDMFTPQGFAALANLDLPEIELLIEKMGEDTTYFIAYITDTLHRQGLRITDLEQENGVLEEKLAKATKHIASMKYEMKQEAKQEQAA